HELSFLANPKYIDQVEATRAGAVILHPEHASRVETALLSTNPYLDFARVVQMFATPQGSFNGQSFMAFVHPEADVHESATIYPFAYVGAGAVIEAEVTLFSGVYVGEECRVGRGCILYPNAVLMARTTLGESVTLHPGAVVGSDGFGFAQAAAGFEKFPQIGRSVIEDGVEIGANTTIDRAALGESRVGKGTKIDNLVQLGHNVTVGENSIIVAQVGIAGSTTIGSNVILAGQVGIAGHLSIGDNVRIGAKSGVGRDIPPGTDMSGIPAMEHRRFLKVASLLNRLPEMSKRLRQLEIELAKVKEQGASDEHE
ncbi:MAG: UDP-3-O-(3-hydroxymyristoyl)glucosamine N-acyltransferase, partial [Desulfovibrionales bacterium]